MSSIPTWLALEAGWAKLIRGRRRNIALCYLVAGWCLAISWTNIGVGSWTLFLIPFNLAIAGLEVFWLAPRNWRALAENHKHRYVCEQMARRLE